MSTPLVLQHNVWVQEGIEVAKPTSIERSLAELDTLLCQADEIREATAVRSIETDDMRSTGSRKSSSFSVIDGASVISSIRRKSVLEVHIDMRRDREAATLSGSPPARRSTRSDSDDSKSVSSSTIISRDVTVHSEELIANIDQVREEDCLSKSDRSAPGSPSHSRKSGRSKSSPHLRSSHEPISNIDQVGHEDFLSKSSRSAPCLPFRCRKSRKSSSSSHRRTRGKSLERDVSRTILQLTNDSSQFSDSDQPRPQSVVEILRDLMAMPLPLSFFGTGTGDGDGDEEHPIDLESVETIETNASSEIPNSTSDLSQPGFLTSNVASAFEKASSQTSESEDPYDLLDAPTASEDEDGHIASLQEKLERRGIFTETVEASVHESLADMCIPEESESDIVESYEFSNTDTSPLMELRPTNPSRPDTPTPQEALSPEQELQQPVYDIPYKSEATRTMTTTATTMNPDTTSRDSAMEKYSFSTVVDDDSDDDEDDDWTTFGKSVFSDIFSPDTNKLSSSPIPMKPESPESPTSVFRVAAESELTMSEIPDEGHDWQQQFPHSPSASDSSASGVEWEEYNRRFAI